MKLTRGESSNDNQASKLPSRLLVSLPEACELLGIKRTTLYEFTRSGRIRLVKIGSRGVRVPVSELERFVSEQLGPNGPGEVAR